MLQLNDEELLVLNGKEYGSDDGHTFELPASEVLAVKLSELPTGCSIALCDRVVGSRDLYRRSPYCSFENRGEGLFVAQCEVAFVPEIEGLEEEARSKFFHESLSDGRLALEPFATLGILLDIEQSVYDDIAFLVFSLRIEDQELGEAEAYIGAVEDRTHVVREQPMLFVCHASEDKPFVERLVRELDRRALYAWFDRREILVGDSIVEKVSQALGKSKYVIAVLSASSVRKPWVMREMSSSLMRQLTGSEVSILPILIETCAVPPLIADLKYADFRHSFSEGMRDLLAAIRG